VLDGPLLVVVVEVGGELLQGQTVEVGQEPAPPWKRLMAV
jgi:hypothetical protein